MTEYLYQKLKDYKASGYYGFHMPGHKRNAALAGTGLPYDIDITEIEGFDDLHHAEGILKRQKYFTRRRAIILSMEVQPVS